MEKVKFNDIKTPTTVEGFRDNLVKYFLTQRGSGNLMVMGFLKGTPVENLNSLNDLYKLHPQPNICPQVEFTWEDVEKHMDKTGQFISCHGFFDNEENYTIFEGETGFFKSCKNWTFYGIDNQVLRDFYMKTLGDFSGYVNT